MWQKFDVKGIVHKGFVPPGHTVNGKFYCDVLRRLRENIWSKLPDKWHNKLLGPESWQRSSSHVAYCAAVSGFYKYDSHPPPFLLTGPCPHTFFSPIPEDEIETQGATFWEHWRDPGRITERDEDADTKWLPEMLPIMEIPLEPLYQCQRELLQRGLWRIDISVSG